MSITLNIIIAVLLVFTIGYCSILYKRLSDLRRDRNELEKLAATFNEATERAEASILKLHSATETIVASLQNGITEASGKIDDLKYLVERGEATADLLEGAVRGIEKNRNAVSGSEGMDGLSGAATAVGAGEKAASEAKAEKAQMDKAKENSEAAAELFKALQAVR